MWQTTHTHTQQNKRSIVDLEETNKSVANYISTVLCLTTNLQQTFVLKNALWKVKDIVTYRTEFVWKNGCWKKTRVYWRWTYEWLLIHHAMRVPQQLPSAKKLSMNSDERDIDCPWLSPGNCTTLRGGVFIAENSTLHLWVKLSFNHLRQILLFRKKKMVNEGLRSFFLVNGKRLRQLQQHFACLKKTTFCTFFHLLIWREKIWFRFWLFFASQREQNEKVPNNIRLF